MQDKGLFGRVVSWFTHPFQAAGTQLSPYNWAMIVLFLLVILWFWNHVLLMIEGEV